MRLSTLRGVRSSASIRSLAMAKLRIDADDLTPRNVLSRISYAKNHGQTPEQVRAEAFSHEGRETADIYSAYEKVLQDSNAMDFDDLLLRSRRLLRVTRHPREVAGTLPI